MCEFFILSNLGSDWLLKFKFCIDLKIDPYCLYQLMEDNSKERKKDSIPEGGVFVKQISTDNKVIGLSHNPSKSPMKKEKRWRTRSIFIIFK